MTSLHNADPPLVSIVVVTFNNELFTAECLACATEQDYPRLEVIVVDQASEDGTLAVIESQCRDVDVLRNDRNTGFAGGMNRGIARACGRYILLLNSDLFLEKTFVSRAVASLARYEPGARVGMLASVVYRVRDGHRTTEIDTSGRMLVPYHTVANATSPSRPKWVGGPAGAAMFLSRAMLDDVRLPSGDYLDERYFCYGEDVELWLRAQLLGWRCAFEPIVAGWHIGSASASGAWRYSEKPAHLVVHAIKNRYLTLVACYPFGMLIRTLPWHLLTEAGQLAAPLVKRRWMSLRCLFRAYAAVWELLPYAFAKRAWVLGRRQVSCEYLRSLFIEWNALQTFESLWQKG